MSAELSPEREQQRQRYCEQLMDWIALRVVSPMVTVNLGNLEKDHGEEVIS